MKSIIRGFEARQPLLFTFGLLLISFGAAMALHASEPGLGQKAEDVAKQTTTAVENAGTAAADTAKNVWQRIDSARLVHRTPDQIVAWVIMGVLVGAVAGIMTSLKPGGAGYLARLGLGLVGAFIGGIVAQAGNFNFGWGPVLIRYEELFFSLVGAILIVLVAKFVRSRTAKKPQTT